MSESHTPQRIAVMGVTGAGKTTIAQALAAALPAANIDADELHPAVNVQKMSSGIPLDDSDREPWLEAVGHAASQHGEGAIVIACSALKRSYRDVLRRRIPGLVFVHLAPPRPVLEARLRARTDHFMPASLLASQLDTLEPLEPNKAGVTVTVTRSTADGMVAVVEQLPSLTDAAQRKHTE